MSLSEKRGVINLDNDGKNMYAYHEEDLKKSIQNIKLTILDSPVVYIDHFDLMFIINKEFGEYLI